MLVRLSCLFCVIAAGSLQVADAQSADMSKNFFAPGRKYPSAHQAPIKIPHLIFAKNAQGYGLPTTMSANGWQSKPNPAWWTTQPHKIFVANRYAHSADESKPYAGGTESEFYSYYRERLDQGYDGLALDEYNWGNGNGAEMQKNTFNPLKRLQTEFPKALVFAWVPHFYAGINNVDQVADNHEAFDMIISESYVNCDGTTEGWDIDLTKWYKKVADSYEHYDLIGKAMIGISIGSRVTCPRPSQAVFDQMLAEIRTIIPFAPHIFLWHKWGPSEDPSRWDGYMASLKREFFDKAPTAAIVSPSSGQTVGGTVNLTASFTPNAGTNKALRQYRFFVDNTCVYVGDSAAYRWNTGDEPEGKHVITAHAVDETWLAGAAQIEVTVKHDATGNRHPTARIAANDLMGGTGMRIYDLMGHRVARLNGHGTGAVRRLPTGVYIVARPGGDVPRYGSGIGRAVIVEKGRSEAR